MKRFSIITVAVMVLAVMMAVPAFAQVQDKLIVKDAGGGTAFVVRDDVTIGVGTAAPIAPIHIVSSTIPQFKVENATFSARFDYRRGTTPGASAQITFGTGPTMEYQIGEVTDTNFRIRAAGDDTKSIILGANGNVNIGSATFVAGQKLRVCGTAGCSYNDGGLAWVNASSREFKDNIQTLSAEKAMDTLKNLNPVTFTYKSLPEQNHVGFIAEDVPDLVAMRDRKGLSALDIVAVLTKVVQEQSKTIEALSAKIETLEKTTAK